MWIMVVIITAVSSTGYGGTASSVPGFTSEQACRAAEARVMATTQKLFGGNTPKTIATDCVRS